MNGDEETEVQINTGAIINEPFYSTRRYSIEPVRSEYLAERSFLLTITGQQNSAAFIHLNCSNHICWQLSTKLMKFQENLCELK
jgi:hypothetical protein